MKGPKADHSAKIITKPKKIKNRIIGASHHFFLARKNPQISPKIAILLKKLFKIFMVIKYYLIKFF